jgi:hypothetical protein
MYSILLSRFILLLLVMKYNSFLTHPLKIKITNFLLFKSQLYVNKINKSILNNSINIRVINNDTWFSEKEFNNFLNTNNFSKNKKIISLSPGGYKGFYVLGICKFIKENYQLDNYVFSGASAGAWNSLMLCFKHDMNDIIKIILDSNLEKSSSIHEIEKSIKKIILNKYTADDFDLNRLYVGVTIIDNYKTNTTIYTGFENLEDALESCIASSHIPLVTGGLINFYRNIITFDGGFSKYPYLNTSKSVLHIHPNMWNHFSNTTGKFNITDYTTLFSKSKFPFREMVENGYNDSKKNKYILDNVFGN